MTFTETAIAGVWIVELQPRRDERGYFARAFGRAEFAQRGLVTEWETWSTSYNRLRGTLRGLHFQRPPHAETKFVRCSRGAIWDVIVDLRPDSPSCGRHLAVELTPVNGRGVYAPEGVAHGYQTLRDDTDVTYLMTPDYAPHAAAGVRFDDRALAIQWPLPVTTVSARDRELPAFSPTMLGA